MGRIVYNERKGGVFLKETIYTIPVMEAFEKKCGCPMCTLYDMLEQRELEAITGASMMEPDIRIKTNEQGFCKEHLAHICSSSVKLPVALLLETRVHKVIEELSKAAPGKKDGGKTADVLKKQQGSCYVCGRVNGFLDKFYDTVYLLWKKEPEFRALFLEQEYFCIPHFERLLREAPKHFMLGVGLQEFQETLYEKELSYLKTLEGDLQWFAKKFDYRYQNEDWKNAKDSIERTAFFLRGK